jgi:hypothetical protein
MPCFRRASLLDNCELSDWLNFIISIFAHNSVSSLAFIPGATVDMLGMQEVTTAPRPDCIM